MTAVSIGPHGDWVCEYRNRRGVVATAGRRFRTHDDARKHGLRTDSPAWRFVRAVMLEVTGDEENP